MIEQANETAENVQLKIALEKQTRALKDAIKNCTLALNVLESGFTRQNHEEAMELLEDTLNSYELA